MQSKEKVANDKPGIYLRVEKLLYYYHRRCSFSFSFLFSFLFSFFGETEGVCGSLGSSRLRCYYMFFFVIDDGWQDLYAVYE